MREQLLSSSFDFSIRLVGLVEYLKNEGKEFPLSQQLLTCGNGIGVNLRLIPLADKKERNVRADQALICAVESEYILELMKKTGYLTEQQSGSIRADCAYLIKGIADIRKENNRSRAGDRV